VGKDPEGLETTLPASEMPFRHGQNTVVASGCNENTCALSGPCDVHIRTELGVSQHVQLPARDLRHAQRILKDFIAQHGDSLTVTLIFRRTR
jgi:hypothetical protein